MKKKIARIFYEIADLLDLKGVRFKPRAYRKAARRISNMKGDIKELYGEGRLDEIEGVGSSMEEKISEIIETGSLDYLEHLRGQLPAGLVEVMDVPDLGPKKAKKLYDELGVEDLDTLKEMAEKGRIKEVEGFGTTSEENILKGIGMLERISGRHLLSEALPLARDIKETLSSHAERIEIAGSLRRWKENIGDIDILAAGDAEKLMDEFAGMDGVEDVLLKGETKTSVRFEDGIQADLRVVDKDSFGSALQYFTGSKDHNIEVRQIAIDRGFKLSEYGLFKKDSDDRVAGADEEEIYDKLGMQWVPPELREDSGEIDAALDNDLPELVTMEDIRGDLQSHSNWSDGQNTIREMAGEARDLGYEYLALTDHSQRLTVANGLTSEDLEERRKEIEEVRDDPEVHILDSIEVDINKDGSLDMDDDSLEALDMVLASVHAYLKLDEKAQTKRIKDAFSTGLVDIFGHPTGRRMGERESYDVDIGEIIGSAKDNSVALEINSFPDRLDLDSSKARAAKEEGVMISLGTDAHALTHLRYMKYGLGVARRAWLEPADMLNTKSYDELMKYLKGRSK